MAFRLLLDEMTEAGLADYLSKMGHDVERVVDVPELGPGSDDAAVVAYAEREDRLLLTYDDDFLANHDTLERIGVLFHPNDRSPAFETANVVDAIADHVDQEQMVRRDDPFYLTTDWL